MNEMANVLDSVKNEKIDPTINYERSAQGSPLTKWAGNYIPSRDVSPKAHNRQKDAITHWN